MKNNNPGIEGKIFKLPLSQDYFTTTRYFIGYDPYTSDSFGGGVCYIEILPWYKRVLNRIGFKFKPVYKTIKTF